MATHVHDDGAGAMRARCRQGLGRRRVQAVRRYEGGRAVIPCWRYRLKPPMLLRALEIVRVCARGLEQEDRPESQALFLDFLEASRSGLRCLHTSSLLLGVVTLISLIALFTLSLPQWTGDSALPTELVYFHSTVHRAYISSGSPLE
jgi:hypothetical protein